MYLRKYLQRKIWIDKCLKSSVSEDPETDNTANGSKNCGYLKAAILQYLLITVKIVALERVSLTDTQTPRAVS